MKGLARAIVWWPGIDNEIEQRVRQCESCQLTRPNPPSAPLHPWKWPKKPWSRVHVDYAGPFLGSMFLVLVDAHSKWMDVYITGQASTALMTVRELRDSFVQHGLPDELVSDNGPCFTSNVFQDFMTQNGIRHIAVAPYHPASNGLAERAVQTFKDGVKKMQAGTLEERIARFLFAYRTTPHTTTGVSPAELLMGRKLKTRLDLVRPGVVERVRQRQAQQKQDHDSTAQERTFQVGDTIYARNYSGGATWIPAKIVEVTRPVSFRCQLGDDRIVRKHQDQIRSRVPGSVEEGQVTSNEPLEEETVPPEMVPQVQETETPPPEPLQQSQPEEPSARLTDGEVHLRRSKRQVKPPDRLDL